jgi:hypothetical protein
VATYEVLPAPSRPQTTIFNLVLPPSFLNILRMTGSAQTVALVFYPPSGIPFFLLVEPLGLPALRLGVGSSAAAFLGSRVALLRY